MPCVAARTYLTVPGNADQDAVHVFQPAFENVKQLQFSRRATSPLGIPPLLILWSYCSIPNDMLLRLNHNQEDVMTPTLCQPSVPRCRFFRPTNDIRSDDIRTNPGNRVFGREL